jgi:glycosyltransferase involved in cell wall biosynthesis
MKVFFLIHDDYAAGGLQRSTLVARNCMASAGHRAEVLCIRTEPGGLAQRHAFVRPISAAGGSGLRFWAALLGDLRKSIARERPDLCIGMGLTPTVVLGLAAIGLASPRIFGSERYYPGTQVVGPRWRLLRRLVLPRLDGIICQTRRAAEYYRSRMGLNPSKLFVIPNSVAKPQAESLPPPAELGAFDGHPLVAVIGRHDPQKGFDDALRVFVAILAERPQTRFAVIGEGPFEPACRALALELGIADKVLFMPRLANLAALWPRLDVFLLTSRFEGIPNVLAEAMAHGVASVAFDCPTGPAELIRDAVDGYLVGPGDCAMAARRCIELLDDPGLRERIGENAKEVSSRFSVDRICGLWNELAA